MKTIDKSKIIENLLEYIKIEFNLKKKELTYSMSNNKNKVNFDGVIPLTIKDYHYLKFVEAESLDEYKAELKIDADKYGMSVKSLMNSRSVPQSKKILNFIKENFVLSEITQSDITLEFLSKTGEHGPLQYIPHSNILYPKFQSHFRTFLNDGEEYKISLDQLKDIKESFLNFANKIGFVGFPMSLNHSIYSQILSENPEFFPKIIEDRTRDSSSLFDLYNNSKSSIEKEMFGDLILNSEVLMKRKDNPINIKKYEDAGINFHIVKVNYNFTYHIDWEGSYDMDDTITLISNEELSEKQLNSIMEYMYYHDNGELNNFSIDNRDIGKGFDKNTFIEINEDNECITRPGKERFQYVKKEVLDKEFLSLN